MDDIFEKCVGFVLDREGREFEDDPKDPGGGTKFGISHKAYPNLAIKELTEEQAKAIYLRDYWNKMSCDKYEIHIALAVFDTAVNQGCGMAISILEELKREGKQLTQSAFLFKRLRHYSNLMQKRRDLEVFCHNWMLRVVKVWEAKL